MWEAICNSSFSPVCHTAVAILSDWRVWVAAGGETLIWLVLWRTGFRPNAIIDTLFDAIERLKGLLRRPD